MKKPMTRVVALVAFGLMAVLTSCQTAGVPGDVAMLPSASESARAFRAMGGLTGVSCRSAGHAQMRCSSRQTGTMTSTGHVDSGSTIGIYNFGKYAVRANRAGKDRISWSRPLWNGQFRSGWFYA